MTEFEAQPVPVPENTSSIDGSDDEKKALLTRLDELLEKYLNTLHEYREAGEQLSRCFSSGYLSLAQANFHNSSTTTRYGQDCYDERMQAIRKITITASSLDSSLDTQLPSFSVSSTPNEIEKPKEDDSEEQDNPSAPLSESEEKKPKPPRDPIRWFGILVPQALRSAQASFIQAVEGPIPRLATVARELRALEVEIGRVRKQIKKL